MQSESKNETIWTPTFDAAMQSTGERISQAEATHLEDLLKVTATTHGQSYRRQKFEEVKQMESAVSHLRSKKDERVKEVAAAEERRKAVPPGGWVIGAVSIAAFATCLAAEILFNGAVLPWSLDEPRYSLLGLALSVAPATAPMLLDRILARLFGICDPVETLAQKAHLSSRARVWAGSAFLAVTGFATCFCVWRLGGTPLC